VNLADAYKRLGRNKEALEEVELGIKYEPEYCWLHNLKGQILIEEKKYNEALEALKLAVEKYPSNVSFLTNLGWAYYYTQQYEDAIDNFNEALDINAYYESANRGVNLCIEKLD